MTSQELLNDIKNEIASLGIARGDMVYVASDITNLLFVAKNECQVKVKQRNDFLNEFVNTLQDLVGEEGTLLFPVFSWDFCRGNGFDYLNTLGEVGALNNWILKNRTDFIRTKHPMYSFMVCETTFSIIFFILTFFIINIIIEKNISLQKKNDTKVLHISKNVVSLYRF